MSQSNLPLLISSLQNPSLYTHDIQHFELIETHISWVLLTGPYAYKIKKPVNLGFLDFSRLEQRRIFCEEELRLNRRLAPTFYLALVTISGSAEAPRLDGTGEPLEYAVKMKQFPQEALLSHCIQQGHITSTHIDELAKSLATFHAQCAIAEPSSEFGSPDLVRQIVLDNFQLLPAEAHKLISKPQIDQLSQWATAEHRRCVKYFEKRKAEGFIRECHGDLHLGNIALVDDEIVIFDCIEFSKRFRWIDVMSEVAFVVMDLIDRSAPALGWRLLNGYLEQTGDYEGLHLLPYYMSYRAMVRAKVTGIRLAQTGAEDSEHGDLTEELNKYLELAASFTKPPNPMLIITHGLSGSGKTTVSQTLLESFGAIRIRSDIERKRLLGLSQEGRTEKQNLPLVYSKDSTEATYAHLDALARTILKSAFSVIVDATFLKQSYRDIFATLAQDLHLPFVILDIRAPVATLRKRVEDRLSVGQDASEADISVLEQQLSHDEPFSPTEQPLVLEVETEQPHHLDELLAAIQPTLNSST
ncbi:MAG: AAA family ATPase [Nitrospirales bacterium]